MVQYFAQIQISILYNLLKKYYSTLFNLDLDLNLADDIPSHNVVIRPALITKYNFLEIIKFDTKA